MSRTEYFDDPNAPSPNSIVPAASAVVVDEHHNILLQRRTDNDYWSLPGGAMELGESIAQTVAREVREETGLEVETTRLVGIYSDPRHVIAYSNGEVRQQFSICFACRVLGGELRRGDESSDIGFFAKEQLVNLNIQPSIRLRLQHFSRTGQSPSSSDPPACAEVRSYRPVVTEPLASPDPFAPPDFVILRPAAISPGCGFACAPWQS